MGIAAPVLQRREDNWISAITPSFEIATRGTGSVSDAKDAKIVSNAEAAKASHAIMAAEITFAAETLNPVRAKTAEALEPLGLPKNPEQTR